MDASSKNKWQRCLLQITGWIVANFEILKFLGIYVAIAMNGWTGYKTSDGDYLSAVFLTMLFSVSTTFLWTLPDAVVQLFRHVIPTLADFPWGSRNCVYKITDREAWSKKQFDIFGKGKVSGKIRLTVDTLLIMLTFASIILSGQAYYKMTNFEGPDGKKTWNPKYTRTEIKATLAAIFLDMFLLLVDSVQWYQTIGILLKQSETKEVKRLQEIIKGQNEQNELLIAKYEPFYEIRRAKHEEENIGLYVTSQHTFPEDIRTLHGAIDPELAPELPVVDYAEGYPSSSKTTIRHFHTLP